MIDGLTEIWIEVTRRCNMSCRHCCRGDAQDIDMSMDIIDRLFAQIRFIGVVGFTGGEPSLAPDVLQGILSSAKRYGTRILSFQIVTNGKQVSNEFIRALRRWRDYCEHNLSSSIFISADEYHERVDYSRLLQEFPGMAKTRWLDTVFAEGRLWQSKGMPRISAQEAVVIGSHVDSVLYLNCHGDVLTGVDWSYASQAVKARQITIFY